MPTCTFIGCPVTPREEDPLALAQLLLGLIDEGRRTATYKLAVLLALIDCCAVGTDADGNAPSSVTTRDLSRRVLELYWPQVRDYTAEGSTSTVLRQTTQPRAVTVDAVLELRRSAAAVGARTTVAAEQRLPEQYVRTLDTIELNLVRMPLGRLQRPAGLSDSARHQYPRFLYDDEAFHERVTARDLRAAPLRVELRPGVGDWLVSLAGLLRPLLELHWTREVARINGRALGEDRLRDFLFGADRVSLDRVRPGLLEAQLGRCFYCQGRLSPGSVDVDHFVPWSKVPNDALENLVLADRRCNGSKSDHFAALPLLQRWALRPASTLEDIARDAAWPLQHADSRRLARGLYARLPEGAPLWEAPGVFTVVERARLRAALDLLQVP